MLDRLYFGFVVDFFDALELGRQLAVQHQSLCRAFHAGRLLGCPIRGGLLRIHRGPRPDTRCGLHYQWLPGGESERRQFDFDLLALAGEHVDHSAVGLCVVLGSFAGHLVSPHGSQRGDAAHDFLVWIWEWRIHQRYRDHREAQLLRPAAVVYAQ